MKRERGPGIPMTSVAASDKKLDSGETQRPAVCLHINESHIFNAVFLEEQYAAGYGRPLARH